MDIDRVMIALERIDQDRDMINKKRCLPGERSECVLIGGPHSFKVGLSPSTFSNSFRYHPKEVITPCK